MRNMILWNLQNATGGTLYNAEEVMSKEISAVISDSRRVRENCLFICIKGERADGHDFAEQVIEDGALAVVTERPFEGAEFPYLLVESTFQATKDIAEFYRSGLDTKIIGVTGSVGKTSTKEMIAAVLSKKYKVNKSKGNLNNEWGVAFTLFNIKDTDEFAVVEMGINHFGEMDKLAKMARPDIVVMTNIGQSHLEYLESRDGILKAKREIFNYLPPYGMVILNGDDDKLATITNANGIKPDYFGFGKSCDICAEKYRSLGLEGSAFDIVFHSPGGKMTMSVTLPVPGKQMVYNALAATMVASKLKVAPLLVKQALETTVAVAGRNNIIKTPHYTVLDDAYNACPTSVEAAIDVLETAPGRKVAILGDMMELGKNSDKFHFQLGQYVGKSGVDLVICVGANSEKTYMGAKMSTDNKVEYFKTVDECIEELPKLLQDGDNILVKASHAMGFEKIVTWLKSLK